MNSHRHSGESRNLTDGNAEPVVHNWLCTSFGRIPGQARNDQTLVIYAFQHDCLLVMHLN